MVYAFLDYVLSDNRNREKLKELTEIHLKEQEANNTEIEEIENPKDESISLEDVETQNMVKDMEDELLENED